MNAYHLKRVREAVITWIARTVVPVMVLFWLCGPIQLASAQSSSAQHGKIEIEYDAPGSAKNAAVMERLKQRRVLEQLKEFTSPLRLPHAFHLIAKECFQANAFYDPSDWSLKLCYELVDQFNRNAPDANQKTDGFTRDEVILGEVVFTVLHELGHAAFDMLQVPVFGREEDAADQMAVFLAMQFSPEVARTVVRGNYYFFKNQSDFTEWMDYADEHGSGSQRLYNGLCWAYGSDPQLFKDFVDQGLLPKERAATCGDEYRLIKDAFNRTVLPFIEPDLMKVVQGKDWFKP
jgi:hypothetical protein